MRGLEVPEDVVLALGGGKRPNITITINDHAWRSRLAIMRGRYLIGLSNANRRAAGVATGDDIEVDVELDTVERVVIEPVELTEAFDRNQRARRAYKLLSYSRRRELVRNIEGAKRPETRTKRIDEAIARLNEAVNDRPR
jgi:bifunctional DNA-binding transcriptional regulator/antitoxin component of YhaV-PrlF toxin-antitoxin module